MSSLHRTGKRDLNGPSLHIGDFNMATLTDTDASDLFRGEPDRYLDVGAGEAAYRCVGTGPDVLFVHGWPVSSATFRKLLPHLVDHVTCHVIDLPGAGYGMVLPCLRGVTDRQWVVKRSNVRAAADANCTVLSFHQLHLMQLCRL